MDIENISIDLLRTFVAYCRLGHVVDAARELKQSQSTVTMHLQKLQESLPSPLFLNVGRRKHLTPYGRELFEAIQLQLRALNRTVESVSQKFADGANLTLRIGCRREVMSRLAEKVVFPGNIHFEPAASGQIIQKLHSNAIDVGVTQVKPADSELLAKRVFTESATLVVPKRILKQLGLDDRAPYDQVLSRAFLQPLDWLLYRPDDPLLRPVLEAYGVNLRHVTVRATCEDWRVVMTMLERGLGCAVMPTSFLHNTSAAVGRWEIPEKIVAPMKFWALYSRSITTIESYRQAIESITARD